MIASVLIHPRIGHQHSRDTFEICINHHFLMMSEFRASKMTFAKIQDDYNLLFAVGSSCFKRTKPYTPASTSLAQLCMIRSGWCKTYLLNTSSHQSPFLVPNSLRYQPSPLTRPRRFHLGTHPLVRLDFPRPMEVYRMIQAYHHAN